MSQHRAHQAFSQSLTGHSRRLQARILASLAFIFLIGPAPCPAAPAPDKEVRYSPVGGLRAAAPVVLTFPSDAAGVDQAPAPATITCTGTQATPAGGWTSRREWVAEFPDGGLKAGAECTVVPLATKNFPAARLPKPWTFHLSGPGVKATLPQIHAGGHENIQVAEHPVTAFLPTEPVDPSSLRHLRCSVNDVDVPVTIVAGKAADDELLRLEPGRAHSTERVVPAYIVARCGQQPWPADAKVKWTWGKQIVTPGGRPADVDLHYAMQVRPAFTAELTCTRLFAVEGCDPARPLALAPSAPVPTEQALPALLGSSGKRYPATQDSQWGQLHFAGPFVPGETVTLELPASFADADGRPLAQAAPLRQPVRIAAVQPYLGMDKKNGVLAWRPGARVSWPVVARASGPLKVRSWQFSQTPESIPALLTLLDRVTFGGIGGDRPDEPFSTSARLLAAIDEKPTMHEQTIAVDNPAAALVGIPLSGYGVRLVEADSPAYRQALLKQRSEIFQAGLGQPLGTLHVDFDNSMYWGGNQVADIPALTLVLAEIMKDVAPSGRTVLLDVNKLADQTRIPALIALGEKFGVKMNVQRHDATALALDPMPAWSDTRAAVVQLTNLNVTARLSRRGQSLVWISAFDSGKPVAGARVEVWSEAHQPVLQAHSDALGRVLFAPIKIPADQAGTDPTAQHQWIVVRHGEDMAILRATWDDTAPADMHFGSRSQTAPDILTHTIVDRVLLRAGETLSMQHLMRSSTESGWKMTDKANAARATSLHIYYGDEHEPLHVQKLRWQADGSAYSKWPVPASARLGTYRYELHSQNGQMSGATFQVEQFRLPVFDARLTVKPEWQGKQQTLHVSSSLAFMSGASAAGQPVTIKGRYTAGAPAPVDGYEFDDAGATQVEDGALANASAELDQQGRALTVLAAPAHAVPVTLHFQMQFADASGEMQAQDATLPLWPQPYKIGLRLLPDLRPDTSVVGVLVLDTANLPAPGRRVTVAATPRDGATSPVPVCEVVTDAEGRARCPVPHKADRWLLRARAEQASGASTELLPASHTPARGAMLERVAGGKHVRVRPPFLPATVLLTLEREGVLASDVRLLTAQEQLLELPPVTGYAPEVDVTARFVRGTEQLVPGEPEVAGLSRSAYLTLALPEHGRHPQQLDVEITPGKAVFRPGERASVRLKVRRGANGRAAAGARLTLIVVDDALLALKPNTSWHVDQVFWSAWRRVNDLHQAGLEAVWLSPLAPGLRPDYVPAPELALQTLAPAHAPAGERKHDVQTPVVAMMIPAAPPSAEYAAQAKAPSLDVPPLAAAEAEGAPWIMNGQNARTGLGALALWRTAVTLDRNGEATVTFPLPGSLTRWRVMAVAIEGSQAFGRGEAVLATALPVQLMPGLPQTVRSADLVVQQLTLNNATAAPVKLQLQARASIVSEPGRAARVLSAQQMTAQGLYLDRALELAPGEVRVVQWPLTVPSHATRLSWLIGAREANSAVADMTKVEQTIVPAIPEQLRQHTVVQVNKRHTLPFDSLEGATSASVRVQWQASLVDSAIAGARRWMGDYPHACMEQRSSRAALSGDIAQWKHVMESLPALTNEEGLVSYYRQTPGSEVLTAYLLELAEAYQLPLPEAEKERMQDAMRTILAAGPAHQPADYWPGQDRLPLQLSMQAALRGHLDGAAPVIPASLDKLPTHALLDWASYLLDIPDSDLRRQRLEAAGAELRSRYEVRGTRLFWVTRSDTDQWWQMSNGDVVSAKTLQLLMRWRALDTRWNPVLPALVSEVIGRQSGGHWSTTVSNIWGVAALRRFARTVEQGKVSGTSHATLGGKGASVKWPAASAPVVLQVEQPARPQAIDLRHAGGGAPWASVSVLAAGMAPPSGGLTVRKTITAVQQRVKDSWSVGDVMRVSLEMSAPRDLGWIAVVDPIPSGATILGKGLGREGDFGQAALVQGAYADPSVVERRNDSYRGYYEQVYAGTWRTEYLVRINNAGTFALPPTRIEAMYAPQFVGEAANAGMTVRQ